MKPIVSIVMGSDSDLPVMKDAAEMLESFGVSVEVSIVSAHRTPDRLMEFSKKAHERGIEAIIAGAGGALRQEPYYELNFLKSNGVKASILADWDEKFIEVNCNE